ncbi:MAG TPA: 50S ribosomal protein L9 [Kiritimatiellia bacterium]|nr:50S ribosomal protein L9 [Kiritimatiellia bacterium]HNS81058.1 50S ribosomal protein L9 [Kiritimatiellia bacterium]HPA78385.1 50S ribosomal protein L9 [Kiritimatiellia bacterium]HQQ04409.1 50S ribosomal protein L9 [Kiritimatiellia bacterium]
MVKEVILMTDIEGLGSEGSIVKVADGYARNYLLPLQKAAPVTDATRRRLAKKRAEREEQMKQAAEAATKLANRIRNCSCTIAVKTGPEGKLYGSVGAADVLASLKEQGVELEKGQLEMPDSIRELGAYTIGVKLDAGVTSEFKVWIVEE